MAEPKVGMRLHRFLYETERAHPEATGEFSSLLSQLGLAGKRIARVLSQSGLVDVLGSSGEVNVQGEVQQKLDAIANEIFLESFVYGQLVPAVVTEEMEHPAHFPENDEMGKYVVFLDPLDGSSNLDVDGGVGSIFSVRRLTGTGPIRTEDELLARVSHEQAAAGYFVYGPCTVMVFRIQGEPVHGFTLDPGIGEFLLSHPFMRIPGSGGPYYSANEGNLNDWDEGSRRFVRYLQERDKATSRPYSGRYSGALAGDFHRIMMKGGIYLYPSTGRSPKGKLRLLYEGAPLAAVAEAAGGAASDGERRILDVPLLENHQRTPLFIGSAADVERLNEMMREAQGGKE